MDRPAFLARYQKLLRKIPDASPKNNRVVFSLSNEHNKLRRELRRHPLLTRDKQLNELDYKTMAAISKLNAASIKYYKTSLK